MTDDSVETAKLLELAANGDESAVNHLFGRHLPRIRGQLSRRIPQHLRRRFDASDVLNEAHWVARRQLVNYLVRRPMPFAVWFLRTAYQRLIDQQRRHLRTARRSVSREIPLPDGSSWLSLLRHPLSGTISPSKLAVQREQAGRLHRCLQELPYEDRLVIEQRIFEGRSNEQIAHQLQIQPAAAKKRFTRALIKLKRLMPHDAWE